MYKYKSTVVLNSYYGSSICKVIKYLDYNVDTNMNLHVFTGGANSGAGYHFDGTEPRFTPP